MSIDVYSMNHHLYGNGPRPAEVLHATIKTPFVMPAHKTSRRLVHRPAYAVVADVRFRHGRGSKLQFGARFLCGSASSDVVAVRDSGEMKTCAKCDKAAGVTAEFWRVYCYYDAQGAALYVGQTMDLEARHRSHAVDRRSAPWFGNVDRLSVLSVHESRREALAAEREAIRELRPIHNVQHNHLRVIA